MFSYPVRYIVFRNDSPKPYRDYLVKIPSKDTLQDLNDVYRMMYPDTFWKIVTSEEVDTYLGTRKKTILSLSGFNTLLENPIDETRY